MIDVVIYRAGSPWADPLQDAFARGLDAHGITAEQRASGDRRVSDLAVVWGHRDAALFKMQRAAGQHYLVMERGYIGDIEMRRKYTSLGFDGLNGRATFPVANDGGDRWRALFPDFLQPWKPDGDYALLIGQVPGDASLGGIDLTDWYAETAQTITATTGLLVVFRPHPVALERGQARDVTGTITLGGALETALDGAAVVATFNSNTAVDAVLAGVPTWTADAGSMAWDVAGHDFAKMPPTPDRDAWAHALAWCGWTIDEIAAGAAWEHLRTINPIT